MTFLNAHSEDGNRQDWNICTADFIVCFLRTGYVYFHFRSFRCGLRGMKALYHSFNLPRVPLQGVETTQVPWRVLYDRGVVIGDVISERHLLSNVNTSRPLQVVKLRGQSRMMYRPGQRHPLLLSVYLEFPLMSPLAWLPCLCTNCAVRLCRVVRPSKKKRKKKRTIILF